MARERGTLTMLLNGQWNGRAEDIVGIVVPLGSEDSFNVRAVAFRYTIPIFPGEKVRITTGKRHCAEGLKSGTSPVAMPLLLQPVRPIGKRGENFDEHVVASKAKGRRFQRHARG